MQENRNVRIARSPQLVALVAFALGVGAAVFALGAGATRPGMATEGEYLVVRHTIYASADGTLAYEEESRERVSAQFVVNNHIWSPSSLPIPVSFNDDGAPGGHDVSGIIQQAVNSWNAAGSNFSFVWAGDSDGDTGSCGASIDVDGVNTIRFKSLGGLTLGQTCTVYPPGNNSKLVEFDMQLDDDANWNSAAAVPGNKYDLPTTILHELGHAAGLGHSAQSSAVMYFQILAGEDKRTLTSDDMNGIKAGYGVASTSTPTTAPTATPVPTVSIPIPPVLERVRAPQLARD